MREKKESDAGYVRAAARCEPMRVNAGGESVERTSSDGTVVGTVNDGSRKCD